MAPLAYLPESEKAGPKLGSLERDQWEQVAASYDWSPTELDKVLPQFLAFAGSVAGKRVLELGCGSGVVTRELSALASFVLGVDRCGEMLKRARDHLAHKSNTRFAEASFAEWGFCQAGDFDAAVFAFSLEQQDTLADIEQALKNARRATTNDGSVFVLLPHPCFDLSQRGDIHRSLRGGYLARGRVEITLTTQDGVAFEFSHVHWCLEDYLAAANAAGLGLHRLQELAPNGKEPWYLCLEFWGVASKTRLPGLPLSADRLRR